MGKLSIVATPIGNLEDITLRALRILKEADAVLCEDTRVTKHLLDHYEIKTPLISYHQHSGLAKVSKIKELLFADKNLALVSDAGTPGISDPGSQLVSLLREELPQTSIECLPGPSALTAAVSLAGNGFDRFVFLGFLPHKKGRQTMLRQIFEANYPSVFYESKHRIVKAIKELSVLELEIGQKLRLILSRELSKLHESWYSGTTAEILDILENNPDSLKGEFVVLAQRADKLKNEKK
jgi:16S rRNA (cytidine1402-2'-O)-methyltransferase